jgi:hypothetical protein
MKSTGKAAATALALAVTVGTPGSAQGVDPMQFAAYLYQQAAQQCQMGFANACAGAQNMMQVYRQYEAQAVACQRGNPQACQSYAAGAQDLNRRLASTPRTGGGMSPGQTYADIGDIIHNGYRERSAMNDAGHAGAVRGMHERQIVTGPQGDYVVDGHQRRTWINGSGEYIGGDDLFYDPNVDPYVDHENWSLHQ